MALASLIHKWLPEEFVVDETPLEVLSADALKPREASALAPGAAADAEQPLSPAKRQDLFAQLSEMMVQQVVLSDRAKQLEQGRPSDDEFGRFVHNALPFLDNFARLLDLARDNPPSEELTGWLRNVEQLYFRMVRLLEQYGLRFINAVGKPVDFEFMEVIEYRKSVQYPHNAVIKEMQKGVVFRDRLIRDAKVVVACNEDES